MAKTRVECKKQIKTVQKMETRIPKKGFHIHSHHPHKRTTILLVKRIRKFTNPNLKLKAKRETQFFSILIQKIS